MAGLHFAGGIKGCCASSDTIADSQGRDLHHLEWISWPMAFLSLTESYTTLVSSIVLSTDEPEKKKSSGMLTPETGLLKPGRRMFQRVEEC